MAHLFKFYGLFFFVILLAGCAAVSVQSQIAPNADLIKSDPVYLESSVYQPIARQKYIEALRTVLFKQGFNLAQNQDQAKYIMNVDFNDFSAPLVRTVPDTQSTIYQGHIGSASFSGSSTTTGSKQIYQEIPTHNSRISVYERNTGKVVWEVSMAKSFDVYNHSELENVLEKMMSLYGKDGKATQIVGDQVRW